VGSSSFNEELPIAQRAFVTMDLGIVYIDFMVSKPPCKFIFF
jgi:hypothetical protein